MGWGSDGDGDGMGMEAMSQPRTHPGVLWLSDCPTPSGHLAQSFPWEFVHRKELGDALPAVSSSKAGSQGSPVIFCRVETPDDALSKATGVRGPGGGSGRLRALQDRSHQQLGTLQRATAPSPPAPALLPLLAPAGTGCSREQRCSSRLRTLYRMGKSLFCTSLPDGYLGKHYKVS